MTVYVVHGVRDDISPARRFGTLRLINHAYVHGDELEGDGGDNTVPAVVMNRIKTAVREFHSDTDYLLIAGDHLQLLAMTALLGALLDSFMVLRYDRHLDDYIPVRLYSGLVPPGQAVLVSASDIGEQKHGESRSRPLYVSRETADEIRNLEAPLSRRDPLDPA